MFRNRDVTALLAASLEGSVPTEAALRNMVREVNRRDIWEEPLDRLTYVVFDTETTGFDWRTDALIEVGAVRVEGRKVCEERFFSSLVALEPGRRLPDPIRDMTGLTEEDLRLAPDIREVLSGFIAFCADAVLVAHHAQHDVNFLNVSLSKWYGVQLPFRIVDTAQVARKLWPGCEAVTLDDLVARMDISPLDRHRALNDALLTARIWSGLMDLCIQKGLTHWGEFFTWLRSNT